MNLRFETIWKPQVTPVGTVIDGVVVTMELRQAFDYLDRCETNAKKEARNQWEDWQFFVESWRRYWREAFDKLTPEERHAYSVHRRNYLRAH